MFAQPTSSSAPLRLAILQHGGFATRFGKTGISLLRYRGSEVVAVIDRETAGRSLREVSRLPTAPDLRVLSSVQDALATHPTTLAIGIGPTGGTLPADWIQELKTAVGARLTIWNGLHTRLGENREIAAASVPGTRIWDMRQEPMNLVVGTGKARQLAALRVLFVGTDMAIGKMTAALEFDRAARERGLRSAFVGTGQAGMMISGQGVCLDAVRVDFASGAIEGEVMRQGRDGDVVWVEGQGSLLNPASTATLPLLRGSQPTHLVLVHKAGMRHLQSFPQIAIPPLSQVARLYEEVAYSAGAFYPAKVAGIALNTWGLPEAEARRYLKDAEKESGLPVTDAVRFGPGAILNRILDSAPNVLPAARSPNAYSGASQPA